tara:strand:+ start:1006 stop:1341 length:336 start_codon:yes stop_codon:yes gene_type:complete
MRPLKKLRINSDKDLKIYIPKLEKPITDTILLYIGDYTKYYIYTKLLQQNTYLSSRNMQLNSEININNIRIKQNLEQIYYMCDHHWILDDSETGPYRQVYTICKNCGQFRR